MWSEEKQHVSSVNYTCDKCKTVFKQPQINFVPNMSTGDTLYPISNNHNF
jgi:hypothetical protein